MDACTGMCFSPAVVQLSKSHDFFGENLNIINTRVRHTLFQPFSLGLTPPILISLKLVLHEKKQLLILIIFSVCKTNSKHISALSEILAVNFAADFQTHVDSLLNWIAELQCLVTQYVTKFDVLETSLKRYSAVCAL